MLKREDVILFSGGAAGAEEAFGSCAESFGIEEVNFSFDGHKPSRTRGLRVLNHEELRRRRSQPRVRLAADEPPLSRTRRPSARSCRASGIRSINGQEIYVIGAIQPDQTVRGGTGWGAEFAKLCNKPLFVFDQDAQRLVHLGRRRIDVGRAERRRRAGHSAHALHRHRHAHADRPGQERDHGALQALVLIEHPPSRIRTRS